jgi:CTP:molybdopterin cytidylyltransferase MocA
MVGGGLRLGTIVLAAGAGSRFGGGKVLALLDDRPLLQHVLDAASDAGPDALIAVLGADAHVAELIIDWGECHRVVNPDPARGLASSLQLGLATAAAVEPPLDGVFVALGDQPRVRGITFHQLARAAAADGGAHPIVVPRYQDEAPGVVNPALLLRAAWPLVESVRGDRGMGPVMAAHPELVLAVPVVGSNPDVDTPEDLRRL